MPLKKQTAGIPVFQLAPVPKLPEMIGVCAPASEELACEVLQECIGNAVGQSEHQRLQLLSIMHCAARAAQEVVLALMTSPFLLSDGGDAVQVSKGAEPPRAPIDRHASNRVQNKRRELMRSQQSFMSITSSGKGTGSVRSGRSRNVVQPVQTTPVEDPRWVELFAAADAAKKGALTLGALQSFLCYHGHHQLAAGSILKGVLQELGVGLTEPIRLPQFAKYMAWALKRYPTLEFGAYPLPPEDDAEQQQAAEAEELLGILRAQQAQQRSSVKPASAGRGRVGRVLQSPRQRSALAGSMSAPAFGGGGAGGSENIGGSGTERLQQQRALAALVQPAVNVIEPLGPETSLPPQPAPSRRPSTAGAAVGRAAPLPGSTGGGGGSSTGGARRNRLHTAVSRQSSKGGAARRQLLMQKVGQQSMVQTSCGASVALASRVHPRWCVMQQCSAVTVRCASGDRSGGACARARGVQLLGGTRCCAAANS